MFVEILHIFLKLGDGQRNNNLWLKRLLSQLEPICTSLGIVKWSWRQRVDMMQTIHQETLALQCGTTMSKLQWSYRCTVPGYIVAHCVKHGVCCTPLCAIV